MARELSDIRVLWGTDIKSGIGNQFGYYTHNVKLRAALDKERGLCSEQDGPTDGIYIMSPEFFNRQQIGYDFNVWLFTMFEGNTVPSIYRERMAQADYLLAPSTFVQQLFSQYFDSSKIFVVNHGVSSKFKYKRRKLPKNKPFRFLWVGAPNPRKGYEEVIVVWKELFQNLDTVELYVKTTLVGGVEKNKNVILDGRKLPIEELVELYHSAHCFLFPTRGEGFGLTLAEAMRTGLPCISTHYSGVTDFFDHKVGRVISHKLGEGKVTFVGDSYTEKTEIAYPSVEELALTMMEVTTNYNKAVRKAELAYKRILRFTWARAAKTLLAHIKGVDGYQ